MKKKYDVAKLIKWIKALPVAIVIIFSSITTYIVLDNSIEKHQEHIQNTKKEYLQHQKIIIKKEVLRTVRQINYQKNVAEKKLQIDIKKRVQSAAKVINNILYENKGKTKKQITKLIKDAIRPIEFNDGRGYFFIYQMDGLNILSPPSPNLEGKNMWNLKSLNGVYSIRELIEIVRTQNEGYHEGYWFKPNSSKTDETKMYKKIGYVKYIKELDWFIGTGEYVDDFEKKIKKELIDEIQQIRFGQNGYIFMYQYDGLCLTNIDKSLVGKYLLDQKNDKGDYILKDIISVAKKGSGFIEYDGIVNPITKLSEKKLSYIVGIKDWQWQIGAGTYLTDIDRILLQKEVEFQDKLYSSIATIIGWSILLTIILIYIMLKLLKIIEREFNKYEQSLSLSILESHKKDKLLFEQAKLASMGEMIANIAHQWRQPLSVISTAATGMKMQKEFGCLPDDIFNNSCDAINNNAQYLSTTIDDFKNFIKGNNESTTFDITSTINSFLHLVESSIKAHNIEIFLNLENEIIVNGYQNEITQCLINLFNNAKDAFKEKMPKHRELYISTRKYNDNVIIEIKDNAGGIPVDIMAKIFEPYFTTKHKSQGTGLGLHMTYSLIEKGMNGTIIASNVIYQDTNNQEVNGALFTMTIPLEMKQE